MTAREKSPALRRIEEQMRVNEMRKIFRSTTTRKPPSPKIIQKPKKSKKAKDPDNPFWKKEKTSAINQYNTLKGTLVEDIPSPITVEYISQVIVEIRKACWELGCLVLHPIFLSTFKSINLSLFLVWLLAMEYSADWTDEYDAGRGWGPEFVAKYKDFNRFSPTSKMTLSKYVGELKILGIIRASLKSAPATAHYQIDSITLFQIILEINTGRDITVDELMGDRFRKATQSKIRVFEDFERESKSEEVDDLFEDGGEG